MVHFHLKRDLQLGTYAIHARDQHRIQVLLIDRIQPSKAADFAQDAFGKGFMGKVLDALLGPVASINVDSGICIGDRTVWGIGIVGHFF